MALTLREEIALAIEVGFTEAGGRVDIHVEDTVRGDRVTGDVTVIDVDGYDEPILVYADDVRVPECFGAIAAGIRLDVQTILADIADDRYY